MYEKILHKVDVPDWPFPWSKPKNHYESDGPSTPLTVPIKGVNFRIAPTADTGIHTGRTRFLVVCLDCQEMLHHATTGPSSRISQHLSEAHKQPKEST